MAVKRSITTADVIVRKPRQAEAGSDRHVGKALPLPDFPDGSKTNADVEVILPETYLTSI